MRVRTLLLIVIGVVAVAVVALTRSEAWVWLPAPDLPILRDLRIDSETRARRQFYRKHAGHKPLNWKIAQTAEDFYRTKPMGKFVLHKNDCSDFVEALNDDALGAKARFTRDSEHHILTRKRRLWDTLYWDRRSPLLPGDSISVEHSPHYPPHEEAVGHVGVIGTDGMVYDWSKLKSWPSDRYGRNAIEWFTRHSPGKKGIVVRRLRGVYRYRAKALPIPRVAGDGRASGG